MKRQDNEKKVLVPYVEYTQLLTKQAKADIPPSKVGIVASLPNAEQAKTLALLKYLREVNPDWSWNENGELIIQGKPVLGSRMSDLLLFMQGYIEQVPTGWPEFQRLFPKMKTFTREDKDPKLQHGDSSIAKQDATDKHILTSDNLPPAPPNIFLKRQRTHGKTQNVSTGPSPQKTKRNYHGTFKSTWISL